MKTDYIALTEKALFEFLPDLNCNERELIESMKYSLEAGGKRVRPQLVYEFNELCNGNTESATAFACAVEMIHTYSLIHDDLPCMDDDDFRRGRKSNHKVYGEDIATLSGDALQSLAFEIMLRDSTVESVTADKAARAACTLAKYSGALGMVGGQVIDIESEDKAAPLEVLSEMDEKKTAALIKAACEMGCIVGGADDNRIKAAGEYAHSIGIAFQIVDDILDVTATSEDLGKPAGSDSDNNKSTYVSLMGIEKCRELVDELTQKALLSLEVFENDTQPLVDLALSLKNRKN